MSQASLMMITYNRLDLTKRMLAHLMTTLDYPSRLIIVDNGSTDGTVEFLRDYKATNENIKDIQLKFNKENMGIAIGRNQALVIADKYNDEWYCTLDNDVEMPQGWLTECIAVLKSNPQYGMIGVNLEHVKYPIITKNGKTFQHKPNGNLGTACAVFNRRLHRTLGYFLHYSNYGEEDANWGIRCRASKLELGYIKENGNHFGVGELDQGEYRQFKDECRAKNIEAFQKDCAYYISGRKSCFVPFTDPTENNS